MNNSAASEMNTKVEGGEKYQLLGSLFLNSDISTGKKYQYYYSKKAIHLEIEIRI